MNMIEKQTQDRQLALVVRYRKALEAIMNTQYERGSLQFSLRRIAITALAEDTDRDTAKGVNFAIAYGAKLCENTNCASSYEGEHTHLDNGREAHDRP